MVSSNMKSSQIGIYTTWRMWGSLISQMWGSWYVPVLACEYLNEKAMKTDRQTVGLFFFSKQRCR